MSVDETQIAAPQRDAMTIEKFQDLDRDLASILEPVAELRGDELAVVGMRRDIGHDPHHFGDRGAEKEVIVRDLIEAAHAAEQLEQAPYVSLPCTK